MNKILHLLNKTNTIVNKYSQLLDNTGGRFNVFKIIGVTTEETRLHSAFICELLNPNGTHGLKDKPLSAFIKNCLNDDFSFQTTKAQSKTEYYIGPKDKDSGGKIDIIVKDNSNRAIIIENKINASDQELQMLRYYNYSKHFTSSKLLYLSLDGKKPSEYSTGKENFDYKTISYKYDITNWLTECKQFAVDFPLVREAISHYINLIKQLTNSSSMDEMKSEIVSLIMQSPENIQNAFEVEKVLIDVKIKLQWEFWKQLEIALKKKGITTKGDEDKKRVKHWKVKGFYEKQRNKDIHYGLWSEIYNQNGITIHWGCEIEENIYFGFTVEKNGEGGISALEEFKPLRDIVKECDERYQNSTFWLGWLYTTPKLNFKEFNSKEIFDLAEKNKMEELTDSIAQKALADIQFILRKIQD